MKPNTRGTRREATEDEYWTNSDSGLLLRSPLAARRVMCCGHASYQVESAPIATTSGPY